MRRQYFDKLSIFTDKIATLSTEDALWETFAEFVTSVGACSTVYLHSDNVSSPLATSDRVLKHGISNPWVKRYYDEEMHKDDPYVPYMRYASQPFRFSTIGSLVTLTPAQSAFLEVLRDNVPQDGFIIPVYGAAERSGRCLVLFEDDLPDDDTAVMNILQWACQAFHNKLCELKIRSNSQNVSLIPREKDILAWMIKGKDTETISLITGLSAAAIESAMSHIYKKMQVRTRQAALEFAIIAGLLDVAHSP